ncbi:hypothetical protein ABPG74_019541 [Tetrahymena malaccensis]
MESIQLRQYSIKSQSSQAQAKSVTKSGFTVITDMQKKDGGNETGPSPVELLLSALVGCQNIVSRMVAKNLGFNINEISFDITAERDHRGICTQPMTEDAPVTSGLFRIYGTATVDTDGSQEQLTQVSEIVKKRSPVARMIVDSGCKIEIEWKKLNEKN